jgi:exodeoxyribonuclease-3
MPFSIATWNINSVRLRMPIVERLLVEQAPDVLCLQETKVRDELFPEKAFRKLGYEHIAFHGQKGYHGVATVARRPIETVEKRRFCEVEDSRHLSVTVQAGGKTILLHNFYVPAGGDEPNPDINRKFRHKLDFIAEMNAIRAEHDEISASVLVGDLNVAPLEHDVWSHKQLLKIVSHTPIEVEALTKWQNTANWVDALRHFVPADQKMYTWWSYRAKDWEAADRGRRLDHIWVSPDLKGSLVRHQILKPARGWTPASDHVPVLIELAL